MRIISGTVIAALALAGTGAVMAQQDEHSAHHPQEAVPAAKEQPAGAGGLQQRMEKMRKLMDQIHSTSDPAQRERLLKEHMQSMRETMSMMRDMRTAAAERKGERAGARPGSGDAPGAAAGSTHEHGDQAGAEPAKGEMGGHMMMSKRESMMKRHRMMEKRMEMMESMMEQMLEREAAEQALEGR